MRRVQQVFEQVIPSWQQERFLIAVSGGVDSMVLLHECMQLFGEQASKHLVVVHIHHRLRPEAKMEAEFVKDYCDACQLPCMIIDWKEGPELKSATEEKARQFRYAQFQRIMEEEQISYVLVAHHGDDQLETVLMKWTRGTTPEGMTGMKMIRPFHQGFLVRPFLQREKSELYAQAEKENIPYVEDASNDSLQYTRNRYRHQIIPLLKQENSNALSHVTAVMERLMDLTEVAQPLIEERFAAIFQAEEDCWSWKKTAWMQQSEAVRRLLLTHLAAMMDYPWSYETMNQLLEVTVATDVKSQLEISLGKGWVFQKRYDQYRVLKKRPSPDSTDEIVVKSVDKQKVLSATEQIILTQSSNELEGWKIDIPLEEFPLRIRHPKMGDKIQINEKGQHQTLKRWCINEKIPLEERKQLWVIENYEKKIIAILGYRQSQSLSKRQETGKIQLIYQNL